MDVLIESTRLLGLFSETAANIWHLHSDQTPTPQPSNSPTLQLPNPPALQLPNSPTLQPSKPPALQPPSPAPLYSQTAIRGPGHGLSTAAAVRLQSTTNYAWQHGVSSEPEVILTAFPPIFQYILIQPLFNSKFDWARRYFY